MKRNDNTMDVSILFIVFNRLETTKKVFNSIVRAKPSRLYIASDGPRKKNNEQEIIDKIRTYILENITWKCEIYTLFRNENLGCGLNVKKAIDWFFKYEERGIILEDDVLPTQSFFKYCENLLERYNDDERIGMISGNNFINNFLISDSYLYSKYKNTWGWATWKRAWKNMDIDMKWKDTKYKNSIIKNMGYGKKSFLGWEHNLFAINNNLVNSWDYQWSFSLGSQNQLSIVPAVNLVCNIGFGSDATHTFGCAREEYTVCEDIKLPLIHPKYIVCNSEYEEKYEEFMYSHYDFYWLFKFRLKNLIKFILGRFV